MLEKNVLQVCAYAAPYAGNFINTLLKLDSCYRRRGYKTIFAFPENAKKLEWCTELEKHFKVYYLPLDNARIKPNTYSKMKKIYNENNVIIVHSHFELYDIPVKLVASKNIKVFWHLHDSLDMIYNKSNFVYKILWKLQYSIFSKNVKLLSVSEKAKVFAIKLGFNSNNAYFVPNGIDTERINLTKKEHNKFKYDFLLFGWDYYRKGVDLLLRSIEIIKKENFKVALVAGNDTWKLININEYVQLVNQDPVNEVSKLYKNTNCFLHISRSEGLSYALLEAIYSGCIVLCSNIEQNMFAKIFPTVFFVKNESVQDIALNMKRVMNSEIFISKKDIDNAKKLIEENYSLDSWTKKIMEFYFYG